MDFVRGLPVVIVGPVLVILCLVIIYVVLKSLREGREVSFWPPKIGARQSPESREAISKKTAEGEPAPNDDPFSSAMASSGTMIKGVSQVGKFPDNALAFLYVEAGSIAGATFVLTTSGDDYLFGNVPSCDFVIPGVSRAQFRIQVKHLWAPSSSAHPHDLTLRGMGSRIAISVDGVSVGESPVPLNDHTVIETGGLRIRVLKIPR